MEKHISHKIQKSTQNDNQLLSPFYLVSCYMCLTFYSSKFDWSNAQTPSKTNSTNKFYLFTNKLFRYFCEFYFLVLLLEQWKIEVKNGKMWINSLYKYNWFLVEWIEYTMMKCIPCKRMRTKRFKKNSNNKMRRKNKNG